MFSGLPGTGKSTLADRLARRLRWPLLSLDDVIGEVPADPGIEFWDSKVAILLTLVERQLTLGLDLIVDSVFMNTDRHHAQEIARRNGARLAPVYVFISDDKVWEARVRMRFGAAQPQKVASWEEAVHLRQRFAHWQPGTALFIDSLDHIDRNFELVLDFVIDRNRTVEPLQDIRWSPGGYHSHNAGDQVGEHTCPHPLSSPAP
jgi:predicted kinase